MSTFVGISRDFAILGGNNC